MSNGRASKMTATWQTFVMHDDALEWQASRRHSPRHIDGRSLRASDSIRGDFPKKLTLRHRGNHLIVKKAPF
jgi:hypothetical protein